jgi:glycosyltransferase involved in cell wall biosynthesis
VTVESFNRPVPSRQVTSRTTTVRRGRHGRAESRPAPTLARLEEHRATLREPIKTNYRAQDLDTPTVSVVIPTLNEAANLPHVMNRLPAWIDQVVIVDGHSTDDTVAVAKSLWQDVTIVQQSGRGKGNALFEGFRACTGDIIVMLDADGSTDPAEIPRFIAALRTGADFAKGTRYITGGGSADLTAWRRLGNSALTGLVNQLWGKQFSDLCYGYNAFWRHCLADLGSDCNGFEVETMLTLRAVRANIRMVEVPSYEAHRLSGISNLRAFSDGIRILRTIAAERIRPR